MSQYHSVFKVHIIWNYLLLDNTVLDRRSSHQWKHWLCRCFTSFNLKTSIHNSDILSRTKELRKISYFTALKLTLEVVITIFNLFLEFWLWVPMILLHSVNVVSYKHCYNSIVTFRSVFFTQLIFIKLVYFKDACVSAQLKYRKFNNFTSPVEVTDLMSSPDLDHNR